MHRGAFYRPSEDSPEIQYLRARREVLGGTRRRARCGRSRLRRTTKNCSRNFTTAAKGREVSTTMAFVGMLRKMLKDPEIGKLVVADCAGRGADIWHGVAVPYRGNYSSVGQKYEPVDVNTLLYYKEAKDGQILEEGIYGSGSMASFIAAGTAYSTNGINTIPFFYFITRCSGSSALAISFGLRRHEDAWIHARRHERTHDALRRGLQHQDGTATCLRCQSRTCGRTTQLMRTKLP